MVGAPGRALPRDESSPRRDIMQNIYDAEILDDTDYTPSEDENVIDQMTTESAKCDHRIGQSVDDIVQEEYSARMEEYRKEMREWHAKADCKKCGGDGKINAYSHVCNGMCFRCGGSGEEPHTERGPAPSKPSIEAVRADIEGEGAQD